MANKPSVFLSHIHLKNFRCFTSFELDLEQSIVLFEGSNGIGKTSLLEALYYACYLRSFRTHSPKELVRFGNDGFFVNIQVTNNLMDQELMHDIQVGFSHKRKLVKIDQKPIVSYKELMHMYRVVSLTEDDLTLIQGEPQARRTFMDHVLLLINPDYLVVLKSYRNILDQRNALLQQRSFNRVTYEILTKQLWEQSQMIQEARVEGVAKLNDSITELIARYFDNSFTITCRYKPKRNLHESLEDFTVAYPMLYDQELRFGRSLFGAHLDDLSIMFQSITAKDFASRGQQKLIVLLVKIAQAKQLAYAGSAALMLLDDFMTDFDPEKGRVLLNILMDLDLQLIFTSPMEDGMLSRYLRERGAQAQKITY